jgi:hypothetical protein
MWEIDRFELAYFDGKKNKWQLFGECSEHDLGSVKNEMYSYHRSLIQKLLEMIREHINKIASSNGLNFTIKNTDNVGTKVTIKQEELEKIKEIIESFSNTILSYIDEEGLTETSKKDIRAFFEELHKHLVNGNGIDYEYSFTKKQHLFDLMSLLPIEKTWDTLGIPYLENLGFQIDEDVNYKRISFIPEEETNNDKFAKSLKTLGYGVKLQLLENTGNDPIEGDYYDYCCGDMQGEEIKQYKVYGCIVDSIQKAVYRIDNVHEMNIITYPIFVLNSIHYIHIYINHYDNGKDGNKLLSLRNDWQGVHGKFDWPSKRQFFKSLIEQISIFTFQDRILYIIRHPENYNNLDLQDDECIKEMFEDNIACIFPDKDNKGVQNTQDKFLIQDDSCDIEIGYSKPPWWKEQTDEFSKYQIALVGNHQWRWLQFTVDELREIIKHGSIAAMTAIIARNLSHNIGSHVLSRWINTLNKLLEIKKVDKLKNITDRENYDQIVEEIGQDKFIRLLPELYKSLERSKPLFQYIQHRMDFIATVATSTPSSEMTMDFKKDVLNPFTDKERNKVILENIAASEGFNNIIFEENDITLPENCKRVSIPNGIIGTHAIYSILENFIRNAAKHYKGEEKGNELKIGIELKIPNRVKLNGKPKNGNEKQKKWKFDYISNVLNIKEDENDKNKQTYMLTKGEQGKIKSLFDKEEDKKALERFFYIHERYIKLRIWDVREGSCNAKVLEDLRGFLNRKGVKSKGRLVNEDGVINSDGWGIKEMVVSSNFLRKNSPEKLIGDLDGNEPSVMEIICNDDPDEISCKNDETTKCNKTCHRSDNHKDRLGIRLYLRRPKDMCIISEEKVAIDKDKFEIEYRKDVKVDKDKRLTEDIPHRLLFVNKSKKKYYEEDPMAPMRIMTYKNNVNNVKNVDDKFYLERYEEFIKELGGYVNGKELPKLSYCGGGQEFEVEYDNNKNLIKNIDNLSDYANNKNKDNIILFYYHADEPEERENVLNLLKNEKYFQPVSGKYASIKSKLGTLPTDEWYERHFLLELIESVLTRVLIIDERVSDFADNEAFHDKSVREILENMRTDCLQMDNEDITYDSIQKELEKIKALNSQKNCTQGKTLSAYKYHFLVIHQGILDKIKKSNGDPTKLIEMIDHRWMVIDSGRGVPKELKESEEARFVETSALLKMLEEYDKHGLAQTLFSLRRPLINVKTKSKEEL